MTTTDTLHGVARDATLPTPCEPPLTILVVDDDAANRMVLCAILSKEGHTILAAVDGVEAVRMFEAEQPDMVLMDVMMPEMDGYTAASQIKAQAGERFVPILFLTALTDEKALAQCIECGGDDFLTKPYRRAILRAKIQALQRVRQLYQAMQAQKNELATHHTRLQREYEVAERLFTTIVHSGCLNAPHLRYVLSPMAVFNGDLLLVALTPSGGLHVMVGDFTGHGLPAAIGALPVSEIFYTMTAKGYAIGDIVTAINQKLKETLPLGLFCAACLLDIDASYRMLTYWNGGLPDVLICRQGQLKALRSQHVPLGVVGHSRFDRSVEMIELEPGDRIYAYTDGIIEARNIADEMFGQHRLEASLTQDNASEGGFAAICGALMHFRVDSEQQDDLTLLEITCDVAVAQKTPAALAPTQLSKAPAYWQMVFEFGADLLKAVDPLPQIVQTVVEVQGLYDHRERLYTILAELFTNALDHGLLGLDSTMKRTPQGFTSYYTAREERLAALTEGWIKIVLTHVPGGSGGQLRIGVADSGAGFAHQQRLQVLAHNTTYSSRGIPLVRALCQSLVYNDTGNGAEAVYVWP